MDLSGQNMIYNYKQFNDQSLYDAFNHFIFSSDRRVIGKLLYRYDLFHKVKHLPGDIVEVGVFKGSGMASWCKYLDLFTPHTNKKIIGFDLFGTELNTFDEYKNGHMMNYVLNRTKNDELGVEVVKQRLLGAGVREDQFLLIKGNVCQSTKEFADQNPGFRISLLYLDLDLDEPTFETLNNLWDRIVPGGYVVFDEYEYHKFDESNGVDRFLKSRNLPYTICSTNIYAPCAFMIKQ
jgi:hypothetical protein